MVHIVDIHNQRYSVPVNSSVEFGLVYDSNKNGKGAEDFLSGRTLHNMRICMYIVHVHVLYVCIPVCKIAMVGNFVIVLVDLAVSAQRLRSTKMPLQ